MNWRILVAAVLIAVSGAVPNAWSTCPDQTRQLMLLDSKQPRVPVHSLEKNLNSFDARDRWLAAEDLGATQKLEEAPFLVLKLSDPNIEVRRRVLEAILEIGSAAPKQFEARFSIELSNLDEDAQLALKGIRYEIMGRNKEAHKNYLAAFEKNNLMVWAAFRFAESPKNIWKIQNYLTGEIAQTISLLLSNPVKDNYQESIPRLRKAYALTNMAEALGRKISIQAAELLNAGRRTEAEAYNVTAAAKVVALALELNNLAKKQEIQIKGLHPDFQFSNVAPSTEDDEAQIKARLKAVEELGSCYTREGEAALHKVLTKDSSPLVRAGAAEALRGVSTEQTADALVKAFKQESSIKVKQSILKSLGGWPSPEARSLVYAMVDKQEYRNAAILAIGRFASAVDIQFLRGKIHSMSQDMGSYDPEEKRMYISSLSRALESAAMKKMSPEADDLRHEAALLKSLIEPKPAPSVDMEIVPAEISKAEKTTIKKEEKAGEDTQTDEEAAAAAKQRIETWLEAWRTGNLDGYIKCYHPDFTFKKMNLQGFAAYKKAMFKKNPNIQIKASDLKIIPGPKGIKAAFVQDYKSDKYSDHGLKTLFLVKYKGSWLIKNENWQALPTP